MTTQAQAQALINAAVNSKHATEECAEQVVNSLVNKGLQLTAANFQIERGLLENSAECKKNNRKFWQF